MTIVLMLSERTLTKKLTDSVVNIQIPTAILTHAYSKNTIERSD